MTKPRMINGQESVGLEMPEVMAAIQIKDNIDQALSMQSDYWDGIDRSVATRLETPDRQTILERPPRGCIYHGARIGMLGMPWDKFPAVATMVDKASPTAESARFDQSTTAYAPQLYIEVIVRSDPFRVGTSGQAEDPTERVFQEGLANRRIKRTVEALIHCISVDPSLGSTTLPLRDPSITLLDGVAMAGEEPGDKTKRRVFCYGRVQYTLASYASRFDASQPVPSVLAAYALGE